MKFGILLLIHFNKMQKIQKEGIFSKLQPKCNLTKTYTS